MRNLRSADALEAQGHRQLRRVVARHPMDVPYSDTEPVIQICLEDLIQRAFPPARATADFGSSAAIPLTRGPRWLRVPIAFQVETARSRPGQLAHVKWHVRRFPRLFPVMDADVLVHLSGPSGTELIIEAAYEPPFGLIGALGDALIGRVVARSILDGFAHGIAGALEGALVEGHCRRASLRTASSRAA